MSRTYPPYSPHSATPGTRRTVESAEPYPRRYGNYGGPERYTSRSDDMRFDETEVLNDVEDAEDYDDYADDDYVEYRDPIDRRWIWVAGVAGAILLIAVICTVVILGGGDSGSVSKTIAPPSATTSLAPATSTAPPVATSAPLPPPPAPLTPETVTSVTPVPSAVAEPAPTVSAPDPRTITYQVTGSRQLLDLVTVIYTDAQGALQTDVNVALPWSKTVVLNPGVELGSVTATSVAAQLNCSITDAGGTTVAAQANNSMIASCTK
jgi:hypothetical protein